MQEHSHASAVELNKEHYLPCITFVEGRNHLRSLAEAEDIDQSVKIAATAALNELRGALMQHPVFSPLDDGMREIVIDNLANGWFQAQHGAWMTFLKDSFGEIIQSRPKSASITVGSDVQEQHKVLSALHDRIFGEPPLEQDAIQWAARKKVSVTTLHREMLTTWAEAWKAKEGGNNFVLAKNLEPFGNIGAMATLNQYSNILRSSPGNLTIASTTPTTAGPESAGIQQDSIVINDGGTAHFVGPNDRTQREPLSGKDMIQRKRIRSTHYQESIRSQPGDSAMNIDAPSNEVVSGEELPTGAISENVEDQKKKAKLEIFLNMPSSKTLGLVDNNTPLQVILQQYPNHFGLMEVAFRYVRNKDWSVDGMVQELWDHETIFDNLSDEDRFSALYKWVKQRRGMASHLKGQEAKRAAREQAGQT